tara:strand:- start:170 stop:535 length:366 start_codon:yes stop_codon:yes gene_type:complete
MKNKISKSLLNRIKLANEYIKFAVKHQIWGEDYGTPSSSWVSVKEFIAPIKISPTGRTVSLKYKLPYDGDEIRNEVFYPNKFDGEGEIRALINEVIRGIKRGAKEEGWTLTHTGTKLGKKK